jgi:hypothetical protein
MVPCTEGDQACSWLHRGRGRGDRRDSSWGESGASRVGGSRGHSRAGSQGSRGGPSPNSAESLRSNRPKSAVTQSQILYQEN